LLAAAAGIDRAVAGAAFGIGRKAVPWRIGGDAARACAGSRGTVSSASAAPPAIAPRPRLRDREEKGDPSSRPPAQVAPPARGFKFKEQRSGADIPPSVWPRLRKGLKFGVTSQ